MYPEFKFVQSCLKVIEEKLGWGASSSWHNDVFIELSEEIQKKTQILLSPTTLKRVWGRVNYKSAPSTTTLNTLAKFAGYQNWRDFKSRQPSRKSFPLTKKIGANLGVIMLSASVMTIVFLSFYSLKGTGSALEKLDTSSIPFSSRPLVSGLPNSVVFDFDLSNIPSDSIHIQQYWDVTKTIKLHKGQQQATGQYYYPGYFRAKLVADGTILKEHDLFIKSDGWLGTLDYEPIPKYFSHPINEENQLSFSEEILEEIKSNEEPLVSAFHLIKDFGAVSGDDFVLSTTIQNVYADKWAVCQGMSLVIIGTKSAFVIPFAIPGCASEMGVMLSDSFLSGKEHDLSSLTTDFSTPKNLQLIVKDNSVNVYIEGTKVFSRDYQKLIGRFAGVRYRFFGAGEVLDLKISDSEGRTVYSH